MKKLVSLAWIVTIALNIFPSIFCMDNSPSTATQSSSTSSVSSSSETKNPIDCINSYVAQLKATNDQAEIQRVLNILFLRKQLHNEPDRLKSLPTTHWRGLHHGAYVFIYTKQTNDCIHACFHERK